MRLHFKFKGCAVFLRDSGFVQPKNPADRLKRHAFCYRKSPASLNGIWFGRSQGAPLRYAPWECRVDREPVERMALRSLRSL